MLSYGHKKTAHPKTHSFRTNSEVRGTTWITVKQSLTGLANLNPATNVWPTSHLLAKAFRLRLIKCYSRKFTLQGSHLSPLAGNDKLRYFSSSSPFDAII